VVGGRSPTAGLFSLAGPSGGVNAALGSFTYFPVYVVDAVNGVTLFPGYGQYATPNGSVDIRAQVRDTAVQSYSWTTDSLDIAPGTMSATNTYRLQFQWAGTFATTHVHTVTLTVTDTNNHSEVQTFSFLLVAGSPSGSGGAPTWPQSLAPDTVRPGAAALPSHGVSVDANSGALDVAIPLPGYNPNVPALALTYDSLTADPRPIIVANHTLNDSLSVPTRVSAQLTFDGAAGTTYYYDTSQFIPGDIQQLAQQVDATGKATGRYSYSLAVGDVRGTTTTTTLTGATTVLNYGGSAFGSGWTLAGLERITTASGGVILDLGARGRSLWFTGSFGSGGGTFTNPSGEFSVLTQNSGGGYTRTLTDGTQIQFNSSGQEVATVDRNGLHITFAYDSGGKLTTIQDPYNNLTTFTYSGGQLSTVADPAGRVATFTHSGSNLTGVTLPDSSTWGYGYDGAGRMTRVTDPNSHAVTIAYDSAQRVSTVTRPDNSAEVFRSSQEAGWTNSGTSGSPAPATLLAESVARYTDPLGNVTELRPDWNGQGLTNQVTDAGGNVSTRDRDANGLATVTIDNLNRVNRYTYDSNGKPVTITYPAGNTDHFTYNSFSEPTTYTDGNGHTTTLTYDSGGNNTVIEDALHNRTTMTYTANGRLATAKDARNNVTSYQYDSQDRLTTIQYPDGSTDRFAYDNKGNVNIVTDGNNHTATVGFDALNRVTGTTDALGNPTTYVYDSGGNLTAVQAPLSRTTSYAYDSMDRLTTVTDPLNHATVTAYDSGGNAKTVTDALGRVTSYTYDPLNRPTMMKDALSRVTTTAYDAAGQVTKVTNPLSEDTQYTYNANGWQTTRTDSLGRVSTYTYSGTGKLLLQSDPAFSGGTLYAYTYDDDDRLLTVTDAASHTTTYAYDAVGNKTTATNPNNHTTSFAYDSRNRLTTVTDALSHATVYGYDSGGNQVTVKDPLGHVTTTSYDAMNRATTVTDALGGQTAFVYDQAGRQTVVVDPTGNRTTSAYDVADRLTTLTTPLGTTTYVYDAVNELTDRTDANGRRVTFAYDSGGRQTAERWLTASGGTVRTVSYSYDNARRLTGVSDPDATLTFTYDSGGNQLTAQTSGAGGQPNVTLTSTWDAVHVRTSVRDNLSSPAGVTFTYDNTHRLTSITLSNPNLEIDYGYDAAGNVTSMSRYVPGAFFGAFVNTSMAYDAAERLTTLTHQLYAPSGGGSGGYVTTPLATYVYGYNNANRLTSEQNAEGTVTYGYDNANQLTGASGSRAETYTYDSGGNRTMTSYSSGPANKMSASPGYTYTYDAEGNLTGKTNTSTHDSWTYTYDYRNRLTIATGYNSGGTVISQSTYTYDPLNRRIQTDVDSDGAGANSPVKTYTVYDGVNPWVDFVPGMSGGTTLSRRYLYGPAIDDLLARTDSGDAKAWYLKDKLGTIRDIVDTAGTVLDHLSYDSYGKVLSESNASNGDRFKYIGREYDSATGLYYYRARYYDPSGGRFISQDPTGLSAGDTNLYRYVRNSPNDATDRTGLEEDISFAQYSMLPPGTVTPSPQTPQITPPPPPQITPPPPTQMPPLPSPNPTSSPDPTSGMDAAMQAAMAAEMEFIKNKQARIQALWMKHSELMRQWWKFQFAVYDDERTIKDAKETIDYCQRMRESLLNSSFGLSLVSLGVGFLLTGPLALSGKLAVGGGAAGYKWGTDRWRDDLNDMISLSTNILTKATAKLAADRASMAALRAQMDAILKEIEEVGAEGR